MMNAIEASKARRALLDGPLYGMTGEEFRKKKEDILKEFRAFLENEYAQGYYQEVLDIIWLEAKEKTEMLANSNGGTTTDRNVLYQMELAYREYEKFTSSIMGAISPF